ncbi:MAG: hypothetical protein PHP41_02925 [Bacilli bacterium]|nr:hypothetical protein [Bacilli bacterium]
MFIAIDNNLLQLLIIIGAVVLFLVSFILNKRTKAPKGVEVPEKCLSCISDTCIVKTSDLEKLKEELREEMNKCEEKNETK